jgi:GNAT superfamily N-acetyltransferase
MVRITINEAKKRLMNAYPGLYADFVSDLNGTNSILQSCAYESYGSVIVKTFRYYGSEILVWYICDVGNSDMTSALAELTAQDDDTLDKIMICAGECEGVHCLIFSCMGKPYDDPDIRLLCENDRDQFMSLTTVPEYDDEFAKSIACNLTGSFSDMKHDSSIQILGIFCGMTLAGAISVKNKKEVITVTNVFVSHDYRGRGYASRLIRSAMAMYPDTRYSYSCGTDNYPSIASAKSAGFVFEGTYIF